jgi:hypothetical protein
MGEKETCEALRRIVEGGSTLILEAVFGPDDERCFDNPVAPPYGLAEACGFRDKESYCEINGFSAEAMVIPLLVGSHDVEILAQLSQLRTILSGI